jgi:hypothetical protein
MERSHADHKGFIPREIMRSRHLMWSNQVVQAKQIVGRSEPGDDQQIGQETAQRLVPIACYMLPS